jgi:hypothetical protein
MNTHQFQSKPFFILNFISLLLLFSWSNVITQEYWNYLDHQMFIALNQSLIEFHPMWSGFWAILSVRVADLILLFLIGFFALMMFYLNVLVFSMPRLMADVHWFSDVMVGGISIATMTLAFGLYMPLLNYVNKTLGNIASKFLIK